MLKYQLCSSCRAVRHLPHSYFPRVLNEIICGESACVRGDGRCAQRFLPLKDIDPFVEEVDGIFRFRLPPNDNYAPILILHNEGTDLCPKWRLVSIELRTCCDCVIHPYSPFLRYVHGD
ncbi:hypothetical protein NECAME_02770 [Necator americanus]|uniref:Uncharacterized protein n=1 Tax=Necator americanus TaxID=51031 RepID=W2TCJ1_NECAM|nr:hypothetical protein NECAME_02770 [Necator americanus]ETN78906.1 hypothetical protein NECAME_02770 [Necator americanus]